MIGAIVGVMYALIVISIWCYGSWYIQAHRDEIGGPYGDTFGAWLTAIFVGLFWPLGVPMFLAAALGSRVRDQRTSSAKKSPR